MAIETFAADQTAIQTYLQSNPLMPPVFEGTVPMGVNLPQDFNNLEPYILISFGGRSPVAGADQNIATTAQDLKWTTVAIECIAENPADTRTAANMVRAMLEGYSPGPDWGELSEILSGDYTVKKPDSDLVPIRHSTGIVFHTMVNAVT